MLLPKDYLRLRLTGDHAMDKADGAGTILFDLTPGTAIFAVAFSTILGMVAGVIPAWSAARLDPVVAIRG